MNPTPRTLAVMCLLLAAAAPALAADERAMNEPPQGFKALFNGENLENWRGRPQLDPQKWAQWSEQKQRTMQKKWNENLKEHWRVEDGEIVNDGKGVYLTTEKDYSDFILLLEYKTVPKADSGIYLRANPQVQIWDTTEDRNQPLRGKGSAGLFNNKEHPRAPLVHADKPFGQWNTLRIKLVDNRATVHLNDKLTVDNVVMENFFHRDQKLPESGPIQFQTHGGEIRFRNVFIKELGPSAGQTSSRSSASGGSQEGGWTHLLQGGLDHWNYKKSNWSLRDGVLTVNPDDPRSYIWTEKAYGDFVLDLEFKLAEGTNSGVFFRTNPSKPVQQGFEIQVLDSYGKENPGRGDAGALYDAKAPSVNAVKPPGEWNHMQIRAEGPHVIVHLNGRKVVGANLSEWTEAKKNPDGTKNKFKTPLKDLPRKGHIGFQDHGDPVWYRNVKIKTLR